ncbi:immunity 22 family protein [Arthrobacter sp. GMC3]|uniref:immunity 22 family protein n=1 Tax=Arthrobacter sp. GMC3 TaxID=2058894 RepID=UPI001C680E33|nr:immunity 22 family protein [Arthrobacter sp. GMC3]
MSHQEAFIRSLVDEALNRTRPEHWPELESSHGLVPGTLTDWVDRFGIEIVALPFSSLHIWIGESPLDVERFGEYFDHDPAYWDLEVEDIEIATTDITGCRFSIDLNERFLYDEDLLHTVWIPTPVRVRDLIDELGLKSAIAIDELVAACAAREITTANAAFTYGDPTQVIDDKSKLYNGITYLGAFKNH